ncbi:MAG: ATP-binding protein [Bacilli bacterium]
MTDYELYAIQSYKEHIFEDTRPTKCSIVEDLNIEQLTAYIEKVKNDKPNFSKNSFDKCLKLCGITDKNNQTIYPTLAGTMIFGDYPQSFYPQLFVACVVVPGNKLGDVGTLGERFIDNKRIEGTIEEMLNATMNFLRRNMKTSVIIDSNGKRTDRSEYPLEALREAVANALIHRDYSTQTENAYISVNMYNDRIEIINPGALYGTNKLEKLGTDTTMESRNPTIVRILEEKGSVIENRHSGIPTMKREMKKYVLPEPEFYEERDSFKVIFRNKSVKDDKQSGQ